MTLGDLINAAMASEASPHSNGKFYTLDEVLNMELSFYTDHSGFEVLSVYPSSGEDVINIDLGQ